MSTSQQVVDGNDVTCFFPKDHTPSYVDSSNDILEPPDFLQEESIDPGDFSYCKFFDSTWRSSLASEFTGNISNTGQRLDFVYQNGTVKTENRWSGGVQTNYMNNQIPILSFSGADGIFDRIVQSLSNLATDPDFNYKTSENIPGQMGTLLTVVKVRWIWLVLPMTLTIGALLFLLSVIILSSHSKAPLWRSSINVLFYHGLNHDMGLHSSLATIPEMEKQSSSTGVRLTPFGRHDRLVLETIAGEIKHRSPFER